MNRRSLELGLEAASACVAAMALVIVLDASIEVNGGVHLDLSSGRIIVLLLSVVFVAAGSYMFSRSWGSPSPSTPELVSSDDGPAVEAATTVAHGDADANAALKSSMTEDENKLYDMISGSGGEMLQMHIVSSEVFSKAKVTRLLDKLEKRGLVIRERHGMTNRVRIIR
ncbi:MAG: hypothetical protein LN411_04835 [Candidatus Thermoplasmatota archaeon]|nr:hypothetical protein [Candidatus Thermoplasmatota archaeon]